MMKAFLKRNLLPVAGILTGAIAGYLYWKWIGCTSGSCAITSSPLNSTLYSAIMGGLTGSIFTPRKKQNN